MLQVVHLDLSDVRTSHSAWILLCVLQLPLHELLTRIRNHVGDPHHLLLITIRLPQEVLSHWLLVELLLLSTDGLVGGR